MKLSIGKLKLATATLVVLMVPFAASAQHKHAPGVPKRSGGSTEMAKMMNSPHHMLMMAHMKSMSEFAKTLHVQAIKPEALNADFARAAVAELRHDLDAIEAIHQQQVETMDAEMKAKMATMMAKMEMERTAVKSMVGALETDVQANTIDSKQVAMDAKALLKQFGKMAMKPGRRKAHKKMVMKQPMPMKPM